MDTRRESLPHPERRPEPVSFSIEELLAEIRSGRVRPPRPQRPLRWGAEHRVQLFDSLYRGFPIGMLLFWRKPAEADRVEIGRLAVDVPARSDALWVIDGQQRIAALTELLPSATEPALFFDIEERQFAEGSRTAHPEPRWIALPDAFDPSRREAWLDRNNMRERAAPILDLAEQLNEYRIPCYIVESEDEALPIFTRLNARWRPLEVEVLKAGQAAERPSSWSDVAFDLQDLRFGRIEEGLLSQTFTVLHSRGSGSLASALSALRETIIFFKAAARVPRIELLPYPEALPVLALFFLLHREPSSRTRTLLARWFWRTAIRGAHREGEESAFQQALELVRTGGEDRVVQKLLALSTERPEKPLPLRPFGLRSSRTRLQLLALAALRPRHLWRGNELNIGRLCVQPGGPAVLLISAQEGGVEELANRLLHPAESRLWNRLARCEDKEILRSHLVSPQAQGALQDGEIAAFLQQREIDIRQHVQEFLDTQAQWDASDRDRPSLTSLVVEDE